MVAVATMVVTAVLAVGEGAPAGAAAAGPARRASAGPRTGLDTYRPPTTAPITDPFRAPPEPWLPGNRGIEYGTPPGAPITAIGRGRVAFAGQVAGRRIITVDHPDGLRSSYVGLLGTVVEVGDEVTGGQVVGLAASPFHLGVRRGDTYLDPARLWGRVVGAGRVVLVPHRPARARLTLGR